MRLKRIRDHFVDVCAATDRAVIFQRSYLTPIFSTMDALVTVEGKWPGSWLSASQRTQIKRPDFAHPDRMIGMVTQLIARQRMQKHYQPIAIQRQPQGNVSQQLMPKSQLTTPVRMRPDQLLMDTSHLHGKFLGCGFAQGSGLVEGLGVEIDVGVVAVDVLH
ncbi:hypothetical protein ALP48_200051 [Pseudomonas syringae pv. solidagae]|uniref:Uncharacterized protein n=1 Tax=Pseudomonas syringae pv. solidagae TaxID=264458 RepID=A0A3M5LT62_PSESX|nr:hypothetical protein ALP48_200051 [Pseudomonas syringae pv. solidagae]